MKKKKDTDDDLEAQLPRNIATALVVAHPLHYKSDDSSVSKNNILSTTAAEIEEKEEYLDDTERSESEGDDNNDNDIVVVVVGKHEYTQDALWTPAQAVLACTVDKEKDESVVVVTATHQRNGGKFFGCCCDYRRATLITDIVICALHLVAILIFVVFGGLFDPQSIYGDTKEIPYHYLAVEAILCLVTALVAGSVGIYGALQYNVYAVGATGLWLIVDALATIVNAVGLCGAFEDTDSHDDLVHTCIVHPENIVVSLIVAIIFIYPHFMLVKEISQGILVSPKPVQVVAAAGEPSLANNNPSC